MIDGGITEGEGFEGRRRGKGKYEEGWLGMINGKKGEGLDEGMPDEGG